MPLVVNWALTAAMVGVAVAASGAGAGVSSADILSDGFGSRRGHQCRGPQ